MWTSPSSSSVVYRSSSSSTTSSSLSMNSINPRLNPKTMEEVWKDITLASDLHHHHHSSRGVILQDFFTKDPPPPPSVSSTGFSTSPLPLPPPPPPLPPTMLTLSSGPDRFRSLLLQPHQQIQPISHDAVVPDDNAGGRKQRFPEFDRSSGGDRRHKRMIKNRESAARSRARKQAYTNELELEVAHLLEENTRLKKQQQLYRAAAAEHQKKKPLHRTSTAPF